MQIVRLRNIVWLYLLMLSFCLQAFTAFADLPEAAHLLAWLRKNRASEERLRSNQHTTFTF